MATKQRKILKLIKGSAGLVCTLYLSACDPLVEEGYQGVPLYSVEGRVADFRLTDDKLQEPVAGLFWSKVGDTSSLASELSTQNAVEVSVSFPASFRINIFEPPPSEVFGDRNYAIGQLLVWQDLDNNGAYSTPEMRGGALEHVLLYAKHDLAPSESPTGRPLPQGYSLAVLPLPCAPVPPPTSDGDDCGVELGKSCNTDRDCGAGVCMNDDGYLSFPDGYCVLPATNSCIPRQGQILGVDSPQFSDTEVWIQSCTANEDCREGYACESWINSCMPRAPLAIIIQEDFSFLPLCIQYGEKPPEIPRTPGPPSSPSPNPTKLLKNP